MQALLIMGGCSPVSPGVHSQPFASSKVGTSGSPWVHSKTSHVLWKCGVRRHPELCTAQPGTALSPCPSWDGRREQDRARLPLCPSSTQDDSQPPPNTFPQFAKQNIAKESARKQNPTLGSINTFSCSEKMNKRKEMGTFWCPAVSSPCPTEGWGLVCSESGLSEPSLSSQREG